MTVMRRLFALGSTFWLMLFVATVALWTRSYFFHDALDFGTWSGRAGVVSSKGRIALGRVKADPAIVRVPRGFSFRAEPSEVGSKTDLKPGWSSWTGIQVAHVQVPGCTATDVRVPYAYLLFITGGVGAFLMIRRYRSTRPGLCRVCSYNLAKNVSGICPECGTALS